jgi:hypothetical protein
VAKTQTKQLVVCVDNEGYATSLEKRKIYIALRDAAAEKHGLLRIVDETGEDYLIRRSRFVRSPCRWPNSGVATKEVKP